MRIEDLISPEIKQKLNYHNQPKQRRRRRKRNNHNRKQQEHLSEYQIKHLMGQFDPTYRRGKGGAYRQR